MLRPYIDDGRASLRRRGRGRGPGVHQSLGGGLDSEVEAFQGARSEEDQVASLSEHDLVRRPLPDYADEHTASPPLQNRSVGLEGLNFRVEPVTKRLVD